MTAPVQSEPRLPRSSVAALVVAVAAALWIWSAPLGTSAWLLALAAIGGMQVAHVVVRMSDASRKRVRLLFLVVAVAGLLTAGDPGLWTFVFLLTVFAIRWRPANAGGVLLASGAALILGSSVRTGGGDLLLALLWSLSAVLFFAALRWDHLQTGEAVPDLVNPTLRTARHRRGAADVVALLGCLLLVVSAVVPLASAVGLSPLVHSSDLGDDAGLPGDARDQYWGFSGVLDTRVRRDLSDEVVLRVRTQDAALWRGQTYDQWDGALWTKTVSDVETYALGEDGGFAPVPGTSDDRLFGEWLAENPTERANYPYPLSVDTRVPIEAWTQVFEVERTISDVVVGAYLPRQLYLPTEELRYDWVDGSTRLPVPLPSGTTYTIVSEVPMVTPAALRANDPLTQPYDPDLAERYLQLPPVPDRVEALADRVAGSQTTTYDKVRALEGWIEENTEYTRDIPAPPEGMDAVEHHLFVERAGFCEQIATSLTVMLRSQGIPARLVVGYAPGDYDRMRQSYEVRADNAHAWVEVYFPGVGWQAFDPTAGVPLAGERDRSRFGVDRLLGWWPLALGAAVAVALVVLVGRRMPRPRRARPGGAQLHALERVGERVGRPRRRYETVVEFGRALDERLDQPSSAALVAALLTRDAYSGEPLGDEDRARLDRLIADLDTAARSG